MFRVKAEDMPEIEKWVNAHPSENYLGVKTQSIMMEFCDKRINKAYALKKFCEIHDIKLSEVVAFGDTSNDNEMLQAAGLGVCLKNGSEDTKAIADASLTPRRTRAACQTPSDHAARCISRNDFSFSTGKSSLR